MRSIWMQCFLIAGAPLAFGGPPLSIDDPGILDPGAWEIILAHTGENCASGSMREAPLLDVSFGLTKRTQVSLAVPYQTIRPATGSNRSGPGLATVGFKWQFHASPGWEWAFAPSYSVPVSHALFPSGGPQDVKVLGLPLLVSRAAGKFTLEAQFSWNLDSRGSHHRDYGVALSHPLGESLELLLGASGHADAAVNQPRAVIQLGLDYQVRPGLHLLASLGRPLRPRAVPEERLEYRYYVGIQWFR